MIETDILNGDLVLPDEWVEDPPSQDIADILNALGAETCEHGTHGCHTRCGVYIIDDGWKTYTQSERFTQYRFSLEEAAKASQTQIIVHGLFNRHVQ